MRDFLSDYFSTQAHVIHALDINALENAIEQVVMAFEDGKKIITCGNGGSAATASHYITDWNKMISLATGRRFRGVSLCDNQGLVTAYANDLSYEDIFSGQLKAILDPGDLVIGISGSGNSKNVVNAIRFASENDARTLAVVGYDGGEVKRIADHHFHVPSFDMQICEDIHLMFGHLVMKVMCGYGVRTEQATPSP
jgi:D-sedoheptulose 7-phosphate isomerase